MILRTPFSAVFVVAVLLILGVEADAQVTEQAAREWVRDVVRSELHSKINFKADQFLGIRRDEELEQSLATATIGGEPV